MALLLLVLVLQSTLQVAKEDGQMVKQVVMVSFEVRVETMVKVEVANWKVVKLLMVVMTEGESLVVGQGKRHLYHRL